MDEHDANFWYGLLQRLRVLAVLASLAMPGWRFRRRPSGKGLTVVEDVQVYHKHGTSWRLQMPKAQLDESQAPLLTATKARNQHEELHPSSLRATIALLPHSDQSRVCLLQLSSVPQQQRQKLGMGEFQTRYLRKPTLRVVLHIVSITQQQSPPPSPRPASPPQPCPPPHQQDLRPPSYHAFHSPT